VLLQKAILFHKTPFRLLGGRLPPFLFQSVLLNERNACAPAFVQPEPRLRVTNGLATEEPFLKPTERVNGLDLAAVGAGTPPQAHLAQELHAVPIPQVHGS
jgi:hypothetical protein